MSANTERERSGGAAAAAAAEAPATWVAPVDREAAIEATRGGDSRLALRPMLRKLGEAEAEWMAENPPHAKRIELNRHYDAVFYPSTEEKRQVFMHILRDDPTPGRPAHPLELAQFQDE